MDSLMSPGSQLRRLMDSVGFRENNLGEIIGAALDSKVKNNLGAAQNILDAFAPLTHVGLDRLMSIGFAQLGFCHRPHLYRPGFNYNPVQIDRCVGWMLSRCMNAQPASDVIYGIAAALNNSGVNTA